MKLRLACACMLWISLPHWPYLFAQSIPVGQITRQMKKQQSEAVADFKDKYQEELQNSGFSQLDASNLASSVANANNLPSAVSAAKQSKNLPSSPAAKTTAKSAIAAAAANAAPKPCNANSDGNYAFPTWFPTFRCSQSTAATTNFFKVSSQTDVANTVGYIYSPNQSTNQISSDLFTGTFPLGFQSILSAVATQGFISAVHHVNQYRFYSICEYGRIQAGARRGL